MEHSDDNKQSRHHHHPPPPSQPPQAPTTTTTTNAVSPNTTTDAPTFSPQIANPETSVPSSDTPSPTVVGRKRGRARKHSKPEQATATKRRSSPSPAARSSATTSSSVLGNAREDLTPHVITVTTGEDINHKIMSFMQQRDQDICVLLASGEISYAYLRQPDAWGGSITYQGRFNILSLGGSYVRAENTSRNGGLSICMSRSDGQILGGAVAGPLIAASPVQVVVATFGSRGKDTARDMVPKDGDSIGTSVPDSGFPSAPDSSARKSANEKDNHNKNTAVNDNDNHHKNSATYTIAQDNASIGVSVPNSGFISAPDSYARKSVNDNNSRHHNNVDDAFVILNRLTPGINFRSAPDSSGRKSVEDNSNRHQNDVEFPFMIPNRPKPGFNFSGRVNNGANNSLNQHYSYFQDLGL